MSSKLKTWLKRGAKIIGILLGLVILLVVGLLLVLQTSWGKGLLRDQVLKIANNALAGTVEAERIEGNLLGGLELYGVSVFDARDNLVARVPQVSADYSLIRLISGELKVNEAVIKDPLAIVRAYPDGELNVALIAEPSDKEPDEPSSFQISLDKATLTGGTVLYLDEKGFEEVGKKLPDDQKSALPDTLLAWLEAANGPGEAEKKSGKKSKEKPAKNADDLVEQLHSLLETTTLPKEGFALAALGDLNLSADFYLYGYGKMGARVPTISADLFTNLTGEPQKTRIDDIRFFKSVDNLEASIKQIAIGEGTGIDALVAAVDFDTEPDELGNPVVTSPRQFIAEIGGLKVDHELIQTVAPDAPVTGDLRASLSAGGTLEEIYLVAQAGCGDGDKQPISLGGRIDFPDEDIAKLGYDVALMLDDLNTAACVQIDGMDARLNGAMSAKGRGIDPETLQADIKFAMRDSVVGDYRLDRLGLQAKARDGVFDLGEFGALTPYGKVGMQAHFDMNDGRYSLEFDADANEDIRELIEQFGEQSMQTKFAQIHVDSKGRVDLEAEAPLEMLEEADLNARWVIEDARVEKNRLQSSQGTITFNVEPRAGEDPPAVRRVDFLAKINARNLDSPQARVNYFSLDASGNGRLDPGAEDPLAALEQLASRWKITARGVSTPDLRVKNADIQAKINKNTSKAPIAWTLDGGVQDIQMEAMSLKKANFALNGDVALINGKDGPELGNIRARGNASVDKLDASGNSVKSARVDLNISGRPPALAGKVDLKAKDVSAGGERLENVDATIDLTRDLKFNLHASAGRVLSTREPERAGAMEVPEEPVDPAAQEVHVQKITIDAAGDINRDFTRFGIDQLSLETPGLTLAVPQRATVELRGSDIRVQGLKLQSDDFSLSVDGQYSGRGKEDLHVVMDNLDLGRLREKLSLEDLMPPLKGRIDGRVDLEGSAREPILDINISVRDFYYEEYGPIEVDLIAGYKNRRADIETFEVRAYQSTLVSASGSAPVDLNLAGDIDIPFDSPMDLKVQIPRLEAQNFYEPFPPLRDNRVEGTIQADLSLAGTVYQPKITLEFDADDFQFVGEVGDQEVEIDQVSTQLRAAYQPPSVGRGGINADYSLSWRGEEIVSANLASPLPLSQWVHQILDEKRGVPDLATEVKNLPIDLSLKIAGLDLKDVPVESLAEADAAGSVFVDLTTDGTFANPRADLKMRMEGFAWNQYRDIDFLSEFQLRDQVLEVKELQARWVDEPVLTADGRIPMPTRMLMGAEVPDDLPIEFKAELHEMALNRLSVIDYEFARYEGSIGAYLTMGGTLRKPEIEGRAGLFNTRLARGQLGTIALEFGASDDRVTAEGSVCQHVDTVMDLRADLPVRTDILALAEGADPFLEGDLHAVLKSDKLSLGDLLPEQMLSQWVSDLEGTLTMDATVDGTWETPRANGKVLVEDAALTLPMFGRRFTDINLDVEASQEQIALNELHIAEDNSSVIAHANIKLEDMEPADLKADVRTDEFSIAGFVPGIAASITSETDIKGDLRGDNRKIRAHITKLNVTMPQTSGDDVYPTELDNEITILSRQGDGNQLMDVDQLLAAQDGGGSTRTAVQVVIDRGSWLHHPMADVEFRADITATLGGPEVEVVGSIGTVRGSAVPLGKQFDVPEQENAIRFTGDSPPDPALDIRAIYPLDRELASEIGETTEGDPRIIIYVRGRATEPKLAMESDPAMTETEILYVLMTGRAPNQAGAGEESRVSSMALGAASGIFAGMLQEQLSGTLPLDVVRLQPGEEGFRDMSLQVGKYVTDDIFVSYVLRLGADETEGMNLIKLDYRFLPSWKLGLQLSNQLNGDLNVFWDIY